MKYPLLWKPTADQQWNQIQEMNIRVFDEDPHNLKGKSLSLVLCFDTNSDQILQKLKNSIPDHIHDKLIFQPSNGYHITLQWTSDSSDKTTLQKLDGELQNYFSDKSALKGTIGLPFLGPVAVLGITEDKLAHDVSTLRNEIASIWNKSFSLGLTSEHFSKGYASLARFSEQLNQDEKNALHELDNAHEVVLSLKRARLAIMDKFMTTEGTRIIGEYKLKQIPTSFTSLC